MRTALLVGGGILIGAGLTWGESRVSLEKRKREVESEGDLTVLRTLEAIGKMDTGTLSAEAPSETEDQLTFNAEGGVLEQDVNPLPEGYVQEYVEKAAVYGDNAHFVEAQSMEIIDDDAYAEEDGRAKEQIQVFMGDGEPYFVQDGLVIEDWKEKIGDNILVMMYQNFPPDYQGDRVIYVRNHERGEDFEILQEMGP